MIISCIKISIFGYENEHFFAKEVKVVKVDYSLVSLAI